VIESQQFSRSLLEELFARSERSSVSHKLWASQRPGDGPLFYEPSTRTRLSFEGPCWRLGGQTWAPDNAREFSSAAKGETLSKTPSASSAGYADVIVIGITRRARPSELPLSAPCRSSNAGDGPGQHPSGRPGSTSTPSKTSSIGSTASRWPWSGDLRERQNRSLAHLLLSKFKDIKIWFVAPAAVAMRNDPEGAPRRAPHSVGGD